MQQIPLPQLPSPLDGVAIRPRPVPATAPPFDDEGNGAVVPAARRPPDQEGAAHDLVCPEPSGPEPSGPDPDESDPERTDPLAGWPSQFAQVLAETLAGSRPAQQLTPWTTEQARRRIRQLGPLLATGQRPKVRRVMTSAPAANVLEMTAVVGFGPRVRVLALRLELAQARGYHQAGTSRWCCTAIESA